MITLGLTARHPAAKAADMRTERQGEGRLSPRAYSAAAILLAGAMALGGCISVNAPDKPIVIELNINIKQEVIYRIAADAANTITENPDIF